ncbi:MAG TPA: GAF domain-containing sensor histidine kinase, partial [Armatimonadetes bacterium]|nr:GAF domain-containing sensor histidine kinase [Armatimonadota bacterium]
MQQVATGIEERDKFAAELKRLKAEREQMERRIRELERQLREASLREEITAPITTDAQLVKTLDRLLRKVTMILQAEKCVFMLFDRETNLLIAQRPAVGLTDEEIRLFRLPATEGVSGQVFREGKPLILQDAMRDPRTVKEHVALLQVQNCITVPLMVEERDEEQRVVSRRPIGVLHVFNKRRGRQFLEEDLRLLVIMARSAAAVIRSANIYRELREEVDRLEATLESLLAGVVMVDMNEKLLLMNEAARRIFNLPPKVELGRPYYDLISDQATQNFIQQALRSKEELAQEFTYYLPTERIFQAQAAPVHNEAGEILGVVSIFNDITEIRNVERMKTAFISRVSNQLLTPLTSIQGFVSMLAEEDESFDRHTRHEFYIIIREEVERLWRLISDLLHLSRIEHGITPELLPEPIDLEELVPKVVDAQKATTSKHDFVVDIAPDVPRIEADRESIEKILTNLVNNA